LPIAFWMSAIKQLHQILPRLPRQNSGMKLRFLSPDIEGTSSSLPFPSRICWARLRRGQLQCQNRFSVKASQAKPLARSTLLLCGRKVHDAVLNRPVSSQLPEDFKISALSGEKPDWRISSSALCPHCGWDLEGEETPCSELQELQLYLDAGQKGLARMEFGRLEKRRHRRVIELLSTGSEWKYQGPLLIPMRIS
jgi:hypothetical protein